MRYEIQDMNIKRILLNNYRNYTHSEVSISSKCVFLYGLNGAGKTNLLEAISIFGPGNGIKNANLSEIARSDRIETHNDQEKNDDLEINNTQEKYNTQEVHNTPKNSYKNKNNWSVFVELNSDCSNFDIPYKLGVENSLKGKKIRINGKNSSIGDVAQFMKVLSFVPGVDRVFIDTASVRRRFFNNIIAIFDASYVENVTNYEKLVKERMKILQKYSHQNGPGGYKYIHSSTHSHDANGIDRWLDIVEKKISELIVKIEMSRLIFVNNINNFVLNRVSEDESVETYTVSEDAVSGYTEIEEPAESIASEEHFAFPSVKILFESEMLNWKVSEKNLNQLLVNFFVNGSLSMPSVSSPSSSEVSSHLSSLLFDCNEEVESKDMGGILNDLLQSVYHKSSDNNERDFDDNFEYSFDKDFDMNIVMENLENEFTAIKSQMQTQRLDDLSDNDSQIQKSGNYQYRNQENSHIVNSIIELNSVIKGAQQRCRELLKKNRKQDTFSKKTNFGSHRSDFNAFAYGTYANNASTGQQKIIVLSMILTVCKMYSSLNLNKSLILLLDEVISHIDDNHKSALFFEIFRILNGSNNLQVFMTATNKEFLNSSLLTKLKAQIDVIFVKMNKMHLEEVLKLNDGE